MIELIDFFELFCHLEEISLSSGSKKHFRSSKMPFVRLELTAFRLWDWRAAYCATEAIMKSQLLPSIAMKLKS